MQTSVIVQPVQVLKDLAYRAGLTDYEHERCLLDLYLPEGRKDFPIIVWFHGGGLEGGCKDDASAIATCFAQEGLAVAVANYRLSPRVAYPAYVDDAAASVGWVVKHIGEYGGNTNAVFISGHSAGGYLTAMLGMNSRFMAKYGVNTSDIAGIIPISGQTFTHYTVRKERGIPNPQTTPIVDEAAPCYHVRKDAPPVLAICGDQDAPARAEENRYFIAALKAVEHPMAEYREFADRDHGSIVDKIPEAGDPVEKAIVEFVTKHVRH